MKKRLDSTRLNSKPKETKQKTKERKSELCGYFLVFSFLFCLENSYLLHDESGFLRQQKEKKPRKEQVDY